jgi:hypothetical protein
VAEEARLKTWETLFRYALRAVDSVQGDVFRVENWSFGGGTVLMRRFRHRYSKDVDIFVPDPQYLGYLDPERNDVVERLTSRFVKAETFLRLVFDEGEVDFIAASPVTDNPRTLESVLDRQVQVDTSIEIVAKKTRYRATGFTARDMFDVALVAEKQPAEVERVRPALQQRRTEILERLNTGDALLRTTFAALDVLDYRPTYDHCLRIVREVLET